MPTTVYLVTGANRSLGLAFVNEIASRHTDVAIFAGARDPDAATSLKELQEKYPGKIHIVKFVAGDVETNQALAKLIKEKYGYVDIVIPNAATATYMGMVLETPPDVMLEHFQANAVGNLVLFQATHDLLKASKATPKFIPISSAGASLTHYIHVPVGYVCYGASKVAANYITRKIHFENDWLVCFPLAPGIVETDMAREHRILDKTGILKPILDSAAISPAEAAAQLIGIIDNSTREKEGGEFVNIDGGRVTW
ncbi:NAD(P)-binding protein [Collybia nuda]|uniref:NAD(P)-binding protein n=1 Tax=Collybia nuda TaxID=64659 RepID=A0A9P5Y9G6_9AGAR|nr:NAD(P)-binding protein [Collybia nuda]